MPRAKGVDEVALIFVAVWFSNGRAVQYIILFRMSTILQDLVGIYLLVCFGAQGVANMSPRWRGGRLLDPNPICEQYMAGSR